MFPPRPMYTDYEGLCDAYIYGMNPVKFSPELLPGTVDWLLIGGRSISSSSTTKGSSFYPDAY